MLELFQIVGGALHLHPLGHPCEHIHPAQVGKLPPSENVCCFHLSGVASVPLHVDSSHGLRAGEQRQVSQLLASVEARTNHLGCILFWVTSEFSTLSDESLHLWGQDWFFRLVCLLIFRFCCLLSLPSLFFYHPQTCRKLCLIFHQLALTCNTCIVLFQYFICSATHLLQNSPSRFGIVHRSRNSIVLDELCPMIIFWELLGFRDTTEYSKRCLFT
mmetsp:Transcript_39032/g.74784  ORF Transcript_39032/g.74784 Transcript_39032/m.74784 type:complete len:216 (+) Transcript_39032:1025-1672(+)